MKVWCESSGIRIETVESSADCPNPHRSRRVLRNSHYVVAQPLSRRRVRTNLSSRTIHGQQSTGHGDPQFAPSILEDIIHEVLTHVVGVDTFVEQRTK